tara:strand:- start:614 stop:1162 length:549 start_codon:yes stop_codon:yes gene_type:complete
MNWYKLSQNQVLDEWFIEEREKLKQQREARGSVVNIERKTEPHVIELYRGFDANLNELERHGGSYVLSPAKSEQGMLWFTHQFMTHYDPLEYAKSHGDLLLTYPLECQKHWDEVTYENGDIEQKSPKDIESQANSIENSRLRCVSFSYCLELPEGWYWTYKTEKFIGTTNNVVVSPEMVSRV